jgi:hypothetical protein
MLAATSLVAALATVAANVGAGRTDARVVRAVFKVDVRGVVETERTTPAHEKHGCRYPDDKTGSATTFATTRSSLVVATRRGLGATEYRGTSLPHVTSEANGFGVSSLVADCDGGRTLVQHRDWVRSLRRPLPLRFAASGRGVSSCTGAPLRSPRAETASTSARSPARSVGAGCSTRV